MCPLPAYLGIPGPKTTAAVVWWSEVWNLLALGRVFRSQLRRSLVLVLLEGATAYAKRCWVHDGELPTWFYICRLRSSVYSRVLRSARVGNDIQCIWCTVWEPPTPKSIRIITLPVCRLQHSLNQILYWMFCFACLLIFYFLTRLAYLTLNTIVIVSEPCDFSTRYICEGKPHFTVHQMLCWPFSW